MTRKGRRTRLAGGRLVGIAERYLLALSFSGSVVDAPAPAEPLLDGWLVPAPAEPLVVPEPDMEPELDPDVEPPLAGDCFSALEDEEAAPEGELGELGVVAEPEVEPAPEGGAVVVSRGVPASSPQAVSMLAPNAKETANANVESLICSPPWLG